VTQAKLGAGVVAALEDYRLTAVPDTVEAGHTFISTISCVSGQKVIGGGWSQDDHFEDLLDVQDDGPSGNRRWTVGLHNGGDDDVAVTLSVICADAA